MLTGQFELALEFLFRDDRLRAHAVHVAIAFYEEGLLCLATNVHAGLLTKDGSIRRLNFARVISLYAKKFESRDPSVALNYIFLLRGLRDSRGRDLFSEAAAELCFSCGQYQTVLGYINEDGGRTPGLIDKLKGHVNVQEVIQTTAEKSEARGK